MMLAHLYRVKDFGDHFQFAWEMGRIARSLAMGRGYADPFIPGTGPTAWLPPLYPLLLAGVFKLTGVYTAFSAWIILALNCVFSAATIFAIYEIAARCFDAPGRGRSVALWAAWLWALHPAAMQFAVRWMWETTLSTMLFSFALVLTLRMRRMGEPPSGPKTPDPQSAARWTAFGLLWGLIALSNSTLALMLPVCGIWCQLGTRPRPNAVRNTLLGAAVCFACLAPWIIRNARVFHAFVPMRSNLGAELWAANGPGSSGMDRGTLLPLVEQAPDMQLYKHLGELAYCKLRGRMAHEYIAAHPGHYVAITLKRVYFFWVSVPQSQDKGWWVEFFRELNYFFLSLTGLLGLALALRRHVPGAALFAWAFALIPFVYYFVTVSARFRHPIEPLIAILSVFLFQSAKRSTAVRLPWRRNATPQ